MKILRASLSAINAHFHLVGIYAFGLFILEMFGSYPGRDSEWVGPLLLFSVLVIVMTSCGVLGSVYQIASRRPDRPPLLPYTASLLLPYLWLQLKILLIFLLIFMIVGTLTLSFVWAVQGMTGADVDTQKAVERAAIYASPIVYLLGQVLALYSIPWCFRGRERGEWTPHIVPALSFFRSHRTESRQLLLPLVIGAVLGAVFIHSQGVGDERTDPDMVIIGLLMLTQSYLWLTAVHGACVVVLSSAGERRGQNEE